MIGIKPKVDFFRIDKRISVCYNKTVPEVLQTVRVSAAVADRRGLLSHCRADQILRKEAISMTNTSFVSYKGAVLLAELTPIA